MIYTLAIPFSVYFLILCISPFIKNKKVKDRVQTVGGLSFVIAIFAVVFIVCGYFSALTKYGNSCSALCRGIPPPRTGQVFLNERWDPTCKCTTVTEFHHGWGETTWLKGEE